jgi:hypothetical protein
MLADLPAVDSRISPEMLVHSRPPHYPPPVTASGRHCRRRRWRLGPHDGGQGRRTAARATGLCRGPRECVEKERVGRGRPPALKAAAAEPAGTLAAAEAGDGEEPEGPAGGVCTSEGGAGGAEAEPERAAGDACANVGGTGSETLLSA